MSVLYETFMEGALILATPTKITSASGVLTLTSASNTFIASGTEDITSITGNGQGIYVIIWNTARKLTYNSSKLLLIGKADRTTAVGDVGVYQDCMGVFTELLYQPISGKVSEADSATTADACSGNAATATKWATARTLSYTGDATGSMSVDGSAETSAALTLASSGVTAGTYTSVTVDAKGRVTAGTNPTSEAISITGNAATATLATTATTCSGNAATATKLATARTITLAGDVTGSGTFDGSTNLSITTTGVEAAKLTTARTISITGDASGSASFDGSENKSLELTLGSSGVTAGTYNSVTVDSKGRVTSGTNTSVASVPTGAVQAFAMSTIPSGWLACDGSKVSRTDYADLYALIGTTFGEGDGSTTFALPAIQDNFILGLGTTYATLGATGGESTHTLTTDEMPAHTHTYTTKASAQPQSGSDTDCWYGTATGATGSAGSGDAHNNMPPYIVLKYCIKY